MNAAYCALQLRSDRTSAGAVSAHQPDPLMGSFGGAIDKATTNRPGKQTRTFFKNTIVLPGGGAYRKPGKVALLFKVAIPMAMPRSAPREDRHRAPKNAHEYPATAIKRATSLRLVSSSHRNALRTRKAETRRAGDRNRELFAAPFEGRKSRLLKSAWLKI